MELITYLISFDGFNDFNQNCSLKHKFVKKEVNSVKLF